MLWSTLGITHYRRRVMSESEKFLWNQRYNTITNITSSIYNILAMNGMSSFFGIRSEVRKLLLLSHPTKGAFSLSRRWLNRFMTTGGSSSLFVRFHSAPVCAFFWLADKDAGILDTHSFVTCYTSLRLRLGALRIRLKHRIYLRINFLISRSKKTRILKN